MDSFGFSRVLVTLCAIFLSTPTTAEMTPEEQDCSGTIKSGFQLILDHLHGRPELSPMNFEANGPCKGCNFFGVPEMEILGDCPSKKNGDCESIDHEVILRFPEVRLVCECELCSNPVDTLKEFEEVSKKKNMGLPCNVSEDKMKEYQAGGGEMGDPSAMMNIQELMKCEECAGLADAAKKVQGSVPTSVGGFGDAAKANLKPPPEKVPGVITTIWKDVKISLGFRLTIADNKMKPFKAAVLTDESDDIAVECKGTEIGEDGVDPFQPPCKCLKKANVMKMYLTQMMNIFFPCYCDSGLEQMAGKNKKMEGAEELIKNVYEELSCKVWYCE